MVFIKSITSLVLTYVEDANKVSSLINHWKLYPNVDNVEVTLFLKKTYRVAVNVQVLLCRVSRYLSLWSLPITEVNSSGNTKVK